MSTHRFAKQRLFHRNHQGWSADVVVGEGTLLAATADPSVPHVTCTWLAQESNQVGAGTLVVTHVPPGSDPADHEAEAAAVGRRVRAAKGIDDEVLGALKLYEDLRGLFVGQRLQHCADPQTHTQPIVFHIRL